MKAESALLTNQQVAARLGVARSTVYALQDRGGLPYLAIGDVDANTVARRRALRRVDPEALEHWLKSRRRGSWPTD